MKHLVVSPHRMPLGDYLMRMPRWVAALKADLITVCCHPTWRFLFPSATGFIDIHENYSDRHMDSVVLKAVLAIPGTQVVNFCSDASEVDPHIDVPAKHVADVVVAPRHKISKTTHRNWPFWPQLVEWIQGMGLTVAAVGRPSDSLPLPCQNIPHLQDMASAIRGARLTISTDSAAAHLAILLKSPVAVIWGSPVGVIPGQKYKDGCHRKMEQQKRHVLHHLEGAWQDFEVCQKKLSPLLA